MSSETPQVPSSGLGLLRLAAFAVFGALAARRVTSTPEGIVAGAVIGAVAGIVLLMPLRWLLWMLNTAVRKEHGYAGVRAAVGAGFAVIVPFAVLAVAAELVVGWDALSAIFLAAMMTGSGAAALEVSRIGGRPVLSLLVGTLCGAGLVALWTLFMVAVESHVLG